MTMLNVRGISLRVEAALVDGVPASADIDHSEADGVHRLTVRAKGGAPMSVGLRFTVTGARRYLCNGYHSWDGSSFVEPGASGAGAAPGFATTAFLPDGGGVVVLGFVRHDRFQMHFRFADDAGALTVDVETLLDRTGATDGETLVLFEDDDIEEGLRRWSRMIATESPLPPRLPDHRITGWCSWYNHYAMIDEAVIRTEIESCRAFRDQHGVPLDIFLIDDGFTPEMGDWLDTRPQFPNGMAGLIREIDAAGFTPGLWIAPFLVGNRSRLFAAHPDWVVQDVNGGPLAAMKYYGEFRWHKRSEEYYVLDVTHPDAAAYIAKVLRIWRHDWGARYFKTDFMAVGSDFGPDRAVWHQPGLSRIAIWRRMCAIIRDAIGQDTLWLGCGAPLWASVGFFDAVRIGRDIGVCWHGDYSAESLIADLIARNHANGILWQADPDCVLLRDKYHELSDVQLESIARFAAACGGVLMTSDTLSELPADRAAFFARLLAAQTRGAHFPASGDNGLVRYSCDGEAYVLNATAEPIKDAGRIVPPFATLGAADK